ncbi:hypothetical protein [Henriciella litoralis]|uniref:hypothetical protein n=1 Tax=Henriciella litoralis TaxID=568102 RepID=UPI00111C9226|nr:hypothetical protein [Henriciella litoralis]
MTFKSKFRFKRGKVISAQRMSETHLSGGGHHSISSHTSHWSEVRVEWENGSQDDVDVSGKYSPGDQVAVLWYGKKKVGDKNITTGWYWSKRNKFNPVGSFFFWLFFSIAVIIGLVVSGFLGPLAIFGWGFIVWAVYAVNEVMTIHRQTWKLLSLINANTSSIESLS